MSASVASALVLAVLPEPASPLSDEESDPQALRAQASASPTNGTTARRRFEVIRMTVCLLFHRPAWPSSRTLGIARQWRNRYLACGDITFDDPFGSARIGNRDWLRPMLLRIAHDDSDQSFSMMCHAKLRCPAASKALAWRSTSNTSPRPLEKCLRCTSKWLEHQATTRP